MYRFLFAAFLTFCLASTAGAATLSIASDKTSYFVGDTIQITLTAVIESGDLAPPNSNVILNHDLALVTGNGAPSGTGASAGPTMTQFGGSAPATPNGNQGKCAWAIGRDDQCLYIAQIHQSPNNALDPGTFVYIQNYTANATSVADFNFQDAADNDLVFADFDTGNAAGNAPPGISVNVVVPEPTTAALLGLGLLGMAASGRRRS